GRMAATPRLPGGRPRVPSPAGGGRGRRSQGGERPPAGGARTGGSPREGDRPHRSFARRVPRGRRLGGPRGRPGMIGRGEAFGWQVDAEATAVGIGVFDGVHRGHQAVMRDLTDMAETRGLVPAALTFDPHPLEFLAPDRAPDLLTTVEQRAELLAECG